MILFRLFLVLDAILMKLPYRWRKGIFTSLASIAHYLAPKRNRIIQQNLAFAFGDTLSMDEKAEIERYCYRNLALNLLQTMENRRNTTEEIARQVHFENREKVDEILSQGRGIIFVSAHFGNWELGGAALSSLITPIASIYKGFSRSEFDPYLLEARTRHRMVLAEKSGALKHMAKALKNNGSVLIMIDQASNQKYGVSADFFSHSAYHSSTAAQLAGKFHFPIVGVYITSEDEKNYTIAFEDPIEVEGVSAEAVIEATQKQVHALERRIKEHPKLWFWCHKRWKGEYKEIYTAG
ncbi:lipid A biosynthesis lauroyl acyltransferase [Sulfuricurvum sp.]|uniref:lipid A biosynthesis lauroyl acyltransferase n=1 Tax=Sulfuricurvum sp. TaxID=2025608 RepID=UPI002E3719AD|nr:lipid A biosynthesis lauroyl acyltransferase [Sulfuricurvum sp.]HEX5328590.1 lipid A biosynthesis lauroyl acyltransferase [Sulfuricurvum sp.]